MANIRGLIDRHLQMCLIDWLGSEHEAHDRTSWYISFGNVLLRHRPTWVGTWSRVYLA